MSHKHQSSISPLRCVSAVQALGAEVRQLRLEGVTRLLPRQAGWLAVRDGRVWLTLGDGQDHVLQAGEGAWLPRGAAVVVEPWLAGQAVQLVWGEPQPQEPVHPSPCASANLGAQAAGAATGTGGPAPARGTGLQPRPGVPAMAREWLRGWLRTAVLRSVG